MSGNLIGGVPAVSWPSTNMPEPPLKSGYGREGSLYFDVFGMSVNGEPGNVSVEVVARGHQCVALLTINGTSVDLAPDDANNLAQALRRIAQDIHSVESAEFLRATWGVPTGRPESA